MSLYRDEAGRPAHPQARRGRPHRRLRSPQATARCAPWPRACARPRAGSGPAGAASHVPLQLYEGRGDLDIVTQAETIDHFRAIREDLDRLTRRRVMLEAADQVGQEGEPTPASTSCCRALRALAGTAARWWCRLLPQVLAARGLPARGRPCAVRGDHALVAFDLGAGGILCRSCRGGLPSRPEALALLGDILGGRLGPALAEPRSAATLEVDHLATAGHGAPPRAAAALGGPSTTAEPSRQRTRSPQLVLTGTNSASSSGSDGRRGAPPTR